MHIRLLFSVAAASIVACAYNTTMQAYLLVLVADAATAAVAVSIVVYLLQ